MPLTFTNVYMMMTFPKVISGFQRFSKKLHPFPIEYSEKRDKTVEELRSVQASVKSILEIFSDSVLEKLTEKLQVMNAADFIKELSNSYQFDISMLDELFNYSRVTNSLTNPVIHDSHVRSYLIAAITITLPTL